MNAAHHTPVLIGIGTATRREDDFERALEPMDLMLEAVANAGSDSGSPQALCGAQYIAVPRGRWAYSNPAGEIARSINAADAVTVLASVGVLQQTLIGEACGRIARGEAHTTLVTGADAGYRLLRAQIAGRKAEEREQGDAPDIYLSPKDELRHAVEKRSGLQMAVGTYAIMESAYRARQGWSIAEHRDRLAEMGARFSAIAAANPHAWQRNPVSAASIREASDRNPMQAFPYTRSHCSSWNVDQASAMLFCSAARAEELGIARERWIYPLASTESNHMLTVSAREDLAACPGARIAGLAALEAACLKAEEIDLIDLYSCFPVAVETYAAALGLPVNRPTHDLTVTGGMAFAGGPYNNYFFQALCRAAELLRQGKGRTALVSCVSGVLTKQGFTLLSTSPGSQSFVHADLSDAVAREVRALEVVETFTGEAVVAGYTVLHGRGKQPRGVVLVDTPQKQRAMATTENPALIARMETEEFVGRRVCIDGDQLLP